MTRETAPAAPPPPPRRPGRDGWGGTHVAGRGYIIYAKREVDTPIFIEVVTERDGELGWETRVALLARVGGEGRARAKAHLSSDDTHGDDKVGEQNAGM